MTTPEPVKPEPAASASPAEIQADIEQTRKELGDTVDQLTDKFDVKAQARNAVTDGAGRPNQTAWIGIAAVGVTLGLAVAFAVRKRRKA